MTQIEDGTIQDNVDGVPGFEPINLSVLKEKIKQLNQSNKEKAKEEIKLLKELTNKHLPKLQEYETKLSDIGDHRNSMSKTDKDGIFMRVKEDHMKNVMVLGA